MHIYWEHSGGFAFVLCCVCFYCVLAPMPVSDMGFLLFRCEFCIIMIFKHMQIEFEKNYADFMFYTSILFKHLRMSAYMLHPSPFWF